MVELIVVMILIAVLSAYAIPRLSSIGSARDDSWREQLVSALQYAHSTAMSHRRLVCVTVGANDVQLAIAISHPASVCDSGLAGPDGSATFAESGGNGSTTVSPSGPLYMQPDGRVTTDGPGLTSATFTVSPPGAAGILVQGETGHVE